MFKAVHPLDIVSIVGDFAAHDEQERPPHLLAIEAVEVVRQSIAPIGRNAKDNRPFSGNEASSQTEEQLWLELLDSRKIDSIDIQTCRQMLIQQCILNGHSPIRRRKASYVCQFPLSAHGIFHSADTLK